MAENREKLFDQFAPVSTETWKAKVVADLKGADFDKKLVWRTNEGFNVQPMYRAEDIENLKTTDSLPGEYPFVRGTRTDNEWFIRQNIVVENVAEANEKAKSLTTKGVTSFGFKLSEALTADNIATLLDGIDLAKVEVNFESCPKCAVATTKALVEYLTSNGKADEFTGSVKFDPFVRLLKHGVDFGGDIKAMAKELTEIVAPVKNLRVFTVDTVLLSDAGAYIAQELGYALAWGNEWMWCGCRRGCKAHQIQYGHHLQLLYGDCQIPCSTYAVGTNRKAISARMRLRLQNERTRCHNKIQPNSIRRTRQPAAYTDRNHVGSIGRSRLNHRHSV